MARMKGLSKLIKASKLDESKTFLDDLVYTIQESNVSDYTPNKTYSPSAMGGCERALYYKGIGIKPDAETPEYTIVGIGESGTARHEHLQDYVMKMQDFNIDCEWIDVEWYLENEANGKNFSEHTKVISKKGNETKCFNDKLNMRFLCDGIIKYKGEYYILEIKTETSMKFGHTDAHTPHKRQATCYSLLLGIDKIIFLYENRDTCNKDAFLVEINDAMKKRVMSTVQRVNKAIETKEVPMKTSEAKNCQYCNYRRTCKNEPTDKLRVELKGEDE